MKQDHKGRKSKYTNLNYLKEELVKGTNRDKIIAICEEANSGKSFMACLGMVEAYEKQNRKSIYCCMTIADCEDISRQIQEISGDNLGKVFATIKEDAEDDERYSNYIMDEEELKSNSPPILITTHARLEKAMSYISNGGTGTNSTKTFVEVLPSYFNLIIDEGFEPVSKSFYSTGLNNLDRFLTSLEDYNIPYFTEMFSNYLSPLIEFIRGYPLENNSRVSISDIGFDLDLEEVSRIRKNIKTYIYPKITEDNMVIGEFNINKIKGLVDGVYLIYSNLNDIRYYNNKIQHLDKEAVESYNKEHPEHYLANVILYKDNTDKISVATYNHRLQFIKLENNFILNASAEFLSYYNSEVFEKKSAQRLIDHSDVIVNFYVVNTSTTAYKNDINNDINKIIAEKIEEDNIEDVLIYHKKDYENKFPNIPVLNKETCKGTNRYSNKSKVYIGHTTRMASGEYYIFLREYYWRLRLENVNFASNPYNNNKLKFNDDIVNKLYTQVTADYWYQFIKRIQRGYLRNPKAVYNFFTEDYEAVLLVLQQLGGLNLNMLEANNQIKIEHLEELEDMYKLISFLNSEWKVSRVSKETIANKIGKSEKQVTRYLKDAEKLNILKDLDIKYITDNKKKYLVKTSSSIYPDIKILELSKATVPDTVEFEAKTVNVTPLTNILKSAFTNNEPLRENKGDFDELFKVIKKVFPNYKGKLTPSAINKYIFAPLGIEYRIVEKKRDKGRRVWNIGKVE